MADTGGVMVYEAKDVDNFYESGTVWSDEAFGFCTNSPKKVIIVVECYVIILQRPVHEFNKDITHSIGDFDQVGSFKTKRFLFKFSTQVKNVSYRSLIVKQLAKI